MAAIYGTTWLRSTAPLRDLENDGEDVPEASRRTAAQQLTHLELILGQVANYCPVTARNTIVNNSTSMRTIWQAIRAHYGFQSTRAHFLDFNNIRLEPDERPKDLYQRLLSFIDDNLLTLMVIVDQHEPPDKSDLEPEPDDHSCFKNNRVKSTAYRVSTKQSPHLKVFHNHHAVQLTLDTGAETSMIKSSIAQQIGATIQKTKETALQADGITPLSVVVIWPDCAKSGRVPQSTR
ncbi:Retrovirus-related Pol poly from transposon opus, partial [Paramuricea clavata]